MLSRDQTRACRATAHRPWALPRGPWLMAQTWDDLLFAHWPVSVEDLRTVVPPELEVDTFDGQGWLGIVPFVIRGSRLALTPPFPGLSTFPELNVRTYVTVGGRPGVWFLSLDATSAPAVAGARRAYRLPYFRADMSVERRGGEIVYESRRTSRDGPPAAFRGRYRPTGDAVTAESSSLEHFLAERYCLYTLDGHRKVHRADIHHPPWPLQPATAEIELNTMHAPSGIQLQGAPLLHFARRQHALIWPLRGVGPTP